MPETLRAPPPGVAHLRQVLADVETEDVASHFGAAVAFIADALAGGGRVLVHCGAGVSRSAALVAAYLCATQRCGAEQALRELTALRSCVAPNAGFVRQLHEFAARHAAPAAAWLEVWKDGAVVSRLPLPPPPQGDGERAAFAVGRAPSCGLALEHASVSRAHATLLRSGDGAWALRDDASAHGTWLDGARLTAGAEAPLREGAEMRFGASTRRFVFTAAPPADAKRRRSRSRSRSPQRRRRA